MPTPDDNLTSPHEVSEDLIETREEDAITVSEALAVAAWIPLIIGKSTIRRWTKARYDLRPRQA